MEGYTVIFSSSCCENIEEDAIKHTLGNLQRQIGSKSFAPIKRTFYSVVLPCCLQVDPRSRWSSLDDTYMTHKEDCLKCTKKVDMFLIAEQLHLLADSLPKLGCYVDIVWIENHAWPEFDDNLDVYGALKHFSEWYNAMIFLVSGELYEEAEDPCKSVWMNNLAMEVKQLQPFNGSSNDDHSYVWRGHIQIKSAQSLKPLRLPGFCLKGNGSTVGTNIQDCIDNTLVMPYMEMIAPLDIQEIPSFYVVSDAFQMCINNCQHHTLNKSQQFLSMLGENRKLCFLLRLAFGSSIKEVKGLKKQTSSWLSTVLDNLHAVQDLPFECELTGHTGNVMFLLCSGDDDDGDVFLAYPIQNLKNINIGPLHSIVLNEISGAYTGKNPSNEMARVFSSIPCISACAYMQVQKNIDQLQIQVLTMWKNEQDENIDDVDNELSTRLHLLEITKKWYMNYVLEIIAEKGSPSQYSLAELIAPKPEYESNFEQLERLVLQCRHKSNDKFNANKSNDSLGGLSPPTKSKVLALNAEEFMKFFKINGAARKEPKSVLSVKKNPMCKYDSVESQHADWSDYVLPSNFHDIYYHRGDISVKIEEKTDRLKAKLFSIESSTTCSIEQSNSTTAMLLPPSPVKATEQKISPSTATRKQTSSNVDKSLKRKREDKQPLEDAKRVYASKKQQLEARRAESKQSRSMRHKKKLEEVISLTLATQGVTKDSAMYKSCFRKLYTITYTFVKDLRGYTSLREEMEKIAKSNVEMVVTFEKSQANSK